MKKKTITFAHIVKVGNTHRTYLYDYLLTKPVRSGMKWQVEVFYDGFRDGGVQKNVEVFDGEEYAMELMPFYGKTEEQVLTKADKAISAYLKKWKKPWLDRERSNPVYTMEGKEIVLVMATSGGKYELKVFAEPYRYPDAPYSIKNFVRRQGQMKQTGASSGYDLSQLWLKLAKTKYFAKSMDKINYIVKYDDIGFEEFYAEALEAAEG